MLKRWVLFEFDAVWVILLDAQKCSLIKGLFLLCFFDALKGIVTCWLMRLLVLLFGQL